MSTRTRIVVISNSRRLRIPKSLLEQSGIADEVEIRAEPGRLIVSSARRARAGWSEAARVLRAEGEDRLLDAPLATAFDRAERQW